MSKSMPGRAAWGGLALVLFACGPAFAQAAVELRALGAAGAEPGRVFDGQTLSAPVEAPVSEPLQPAAPLPAGRHWVPGPKHPPISPDGPKATDAGAAESGDGCRGFLRCMGGALLSPVTVPVQGVVAGAALGAAVGSKRGAFASGGFGLLGAVVGLIAGLIILPFALVIGVCRSFAELLRGKL